MIFLKTNLDARQRAAGGGAESPINKGVQVRQGKFC
jgi:hypothetical protein